MEGPIGRAGAGAGAATGGATGVGAGGLVLGGMDDSADMLRCIHSWAMFCKLTEGVDMDADGAGVGGSTARGDGGEGDFAGGAKKDSTSLLRAAHSAAKSAMVGPLGLGGAAGGATTGAGGAKGLEGVGLPPSSRFRAAHSAARLLYGSDARRVVERRRLYWVVDENP
eukprot:scaffold5385_cov152-Amphora_coffeaeformis.AAC.3